MKLNLGGGAERLPGFLSVDLNESLRPDICGSAYPLPESISDGSVDEIRAIDVAEHLPYRDTDAAFADWARVLKPGGRIYIQVPAVDIIMQWFFTAPHRLAERIPLDLPQTPFMGAIWRIFGGQNDGVYAHEDADAIYNLHMTGFSQASLLEAVEKAGLEVVSCVVNPHPNYLLWAQKR